MALLSFIIHILIKQLEKNVRSIVFFYFMGALFGLNDMLRFYFDFGGFFT